MTKYSRSAILVGILIGGTYGYLNGISLFSHLPWYLDLIRTALGITLGLFLLYGSTDGNKYKH